MFLVGNLDNAMNIVKGNLWDSTDDVILVTTNATIRKDGALVMGRGVAKEAKEKFPFLPGVLGDQINRYYWDTKKYGVLITHITLNNFDKWIGAFQVKYNWWEKADLDLIAFSTSRLIDFMEHEDFMGMKISMNFPGIGNGGLDVHRVLPVISVLPDSVTLYMKD